MTDQPIRIRWLGRVRYQDALALQHSLFRRSREDYLLLLEHPHVYTLGVRARPEHVLTDPATIGAEVLKVDRGGDVTYHGPGQLVGYPVLSVPFGPGAIPAFVGRIESLVIETLQSLGLYDVGRLAGFPGVWVAPTSDAPRKICAVGVRVSKGRSMHGFALNVSPDLSMFEHIVPCGIADRAVTSLAEEGIAVSLAEVVERVAALAPRCLGDYAQIDRQDASLSQPAALRLDLGRPGAARPLERRLKAAGVDDSVSIPLQSRKPAWLRVEAKMGEEYLSLRKRMRSLSLTTVCEEAGCPNIYECWAEGTATFMINGDRCTRACGFCLVDTSKPLALDPAEPSHVATAVRDMHLSHAVITAVARDDLADGGARAFAETIAATRRTNPSTTIEVLVPDFKGEDKSLRAVFDARPDVFNHNLETVLRLQRAVRPSASYARSLSVLARARDAGLITKSGIILGMGETDEEVCGALVDLASAGVEIVTLGQYLRPSSAHLPIARYVTPEEFARFGEIGRALGFRHVESSPLTRSSYHAKAAAEQSLLASESA